ncbi:hypothetical protein O77CONTIG1_00061 [Leptolyngbya sp. O-77]|nr:hypothetical protein O77CONTIG1_00061 [Leptolyngbya sp. O-77]
MILEVNQINMAIAISQSDYWELFNPIESTETSAYPTDSFEVTWDYPKPKVLNLKIFFSKNRHTNPVASWFCQQNTNFWSQWA